LLKLILIAAFCPAEALLSEQEPATEASKELDSIDKFAFGGVGFAGVTSKGEKAYRQLAALPEEQALAAFEELFRSGNAQAKCYALAGIRGLNAGRFEQIYSEMTESQDMVAIMRGCIISHEPLAVIARRIKRGDYERFASSRRSF
jgi:hypothetical protein